MAIEEEDLCAVELCALDKKTRLFAVTRRTTPTSEVATYVQLPFRRTDTAKDREKEARAQVLAELDKCVWHPLQADRSEAPDDPCLVGPIVARAMSTRYRGQSSKAHVCLWSPAKSIVNGWAWINMGVDPHSDSCTTANQGMVLDVHSGMQVWAGFESPHGKRVLAMLRKKHPNACERLAFALAEHPYATFKVDTSKVTTPLRESIAELMQGAA